MAHQLVIVDLKICCDDLDFLIVRVVVAGQVNEAFEGLSIDVEHVLLDFGIEVHSRLDSCLVVY